MQNSYSNDFPLAAYPGQAADTSVQDVRTGLSTREPGKLIDITVANSTAYEFTFAETAGSETRSYTSDGSATKAEIVAGLIADINDTSDSSELSWTATNIGGDLVLLAKPGVFSPSAVTSTGAGTMTLSDFNGTMAYGVFAAIDTYGASVGATKIRLPNSSSDKLHGLVLSTHTIESAFRPTDNSAAPVYPAGSAVPCARKGVYWVKPDTNVVVGGDVYCRVTTNGAGKLQLGNPGGSPDGTAQVTTITPTAVNDATYFVAINGKGFSFTADGSATAAEIVTGLTALINADTDLPVTASGSSTLILTADTAGVPFLVSLGANLSAAATTANVTRAMLVPGATWLDTQSAGSFARLQLNLP